MTFPTLNIEKDSLRSFGKICKKRNARNDEFKLTEADKYDGVLISPGPGTPEAAGISVELVKYCAQKKIPLLGVCLGHQVIAVAYGATVSRAPELLHGKTSVVSHSNKSVLENIPFTSSFIKQSWLLAHLFPSHSIQSP